MLVVSDATPVNVLIRANCVGILESLFGTIVIPPAVADELTRPATPSVIRDWMLNRPGWLSIRIPTNPDAGASRNRGEREAISLTQELHADLLLVDDRRARSSAERLGISCVGTIGVLEAAAAKNLLDLRQTILALPQGFRDRLDPVLIEEVLLRADRRQSPEP